MLFAATYLPEYVSNYWEILVAFGTVRKEFETIKIEEARLLFQIWTAVCLLQIRSYFLSLYHSRSRKSHFLLAPKTLALIAIQRYYCE